MTKPDDIEDLVETFDGKEGEAKLLNQLGFDWTRLRSTETNDPKRILTWGGDWTIRLDSGKKIVEWGGRYPSRIYFFTDGAITKERHDDYKWEMRDGCLMQSRNRPNRKSGWPAAGATRSGLSTRKPMSMIHRTGSGTNNQMNALAPICRTNH